MRVGVIQSCYIPWRGYFDFIASVDRFILYDDVQYSSGSYRNRNQLKTSAGLRWLTVPVRYPFGARIDEVEIGAEARGDWRETHRRLMETAIGVAPHFADVRALWEDAVRELPKGLSELNERLLRAVCRYLEITTPIERSSRYPLTGAKTFRLLELLAQVGATTYVSGPSARGYLDEPQFRSRGIRLEYKRYAYRDYPQCAGPFVGGVSVLDLIANVGVSSRDYLASEEANEVAVE